MASELAGVREVVMDLLPHQLEFLNAREREVLYSGAFRSGKSRCLCVKILQHASQPNAFVGLCRKTYAALAPSTLRTLLEPDGPLPPVLPHGTYEHNQSKHLIKIHGGGQIYYFGFDDPERMGSLGFDAIGLDEGIEVTEAEYIMLLGRLSGKATGGAQLFTATNPGGKGHFLYRRFGLHDMANPPKGRKVIHTRSADNWFLDKAYLESLNSFEGQYYKRYVLGEWGNFEGMVYSGWDHAVHVKAVPTPTGFHYCGVDSGFSNPACILHAVQRGNGQIVVLDEFYQSGMLEHELVAAAVTMRDRAIGPRGGLMPFYVDPSAAGLIAAMRAAGLDAYPADNAVLAGIGRVQKAMRIEGGQPGLTVHPKCVKLIESLESYRWDENRDAPVKENDHAADALRYLVSALLKENQPTLRIIEGDDRPRTDEWLSPDNDEIWQAA